MPQPKNPNVLGLPDDDELRLEEDQEYAVYDALDEVESEEEQSLRDKLVQFRGQTGAKIYVYDLEGVNGNAHGTFLETLALDDFDSYQLLERLKNLDYEGRESFGGLFNIVLRDKVGKILHREKMSVVKRDKPKNLAEKRDDIAAIIEAIKPNDNGNIVELMMANQQAQQAQQQQAMEQQRQAAANQMELMVNMMNNSQQQLMAMFSAMNSQKSDTPTLAETLTLFNSLNANKSGDIDTLMKGIELANSIGGGGEENIVQTALKTLGPGLTSLGQAMANQTQPQHRTPPQSNPNTQAPGQPAPMIENQPTSNDDMMALLKYKPLFDELVKKAAANYDAEKAATELLEKLDESGQALIIRLMQEQGKFAALANFVPTESLPYFDRVRTIILNWVKLAVESNDNETQDIPGNQSISGQENQDSPATNGATERDSGAAENAGHNATTGDTVSSPPTN